MTRLAEVRTARYSGKLGWRCGVRARARRSPPVSAMIGRLNLRGPETVQTRLPASRPWIRKARSRVDAGPSSTATRRRGALCEPGRRRNGPPLAPASRRGHLLRPGESWSKSVVSYTHHTTNARSWQRQPAPVPVMLPAVMASRAIARKACTVRPVAFASARASSANAGHDTVSTIIRPMSATKRRPRRASTLRGEL